MDNSFCDLGIASPILKALNDMGFDAPTEVQSKVFPYALKQADMIVVSKTGSGKTAAFGVPLLQMMNPDAEGIKALILTPTRELAVQVDKDIRQMAKYLPVKTAVVYGKHSINTEMEALQKGAAIVTGTPGRVFDLMRQGALVTKNIRFLVLDEADRMLDMGFIEQVFRIVKNLPRDRVTLLFSATIPPKIQNICRQHMKQPVTIEIESDTKTVDTIYQMYYRVEHREKRLQLGRLLMVEQPDSCLIFCNTRIEVDRVQEYLTKLGYASQALHGDIGQGKRLQTIQGFKKGDFHLLVATDVAARGIHIDNLSLVINYDVPGEKDSYVHRIGRTGRAGHVGRAITMVTAEDIMSLYDIEEYIGARINEEDLPSEAVFNERKASAEKWLKANSRSEKVPQKPKLPGPQSKISPSYQDRQGGYQRRQAGSVRGQMPGNVQQAPAVTVQKQDAPRTAVVHTAMPQVEAPVPKPDQLKEAGQDSQEKKTFLHGLLQRIRKEK